MGLLDAKQARTMTKIVYCGAHVQSTALRHCAASVFCGVWLEGPTRDMRRHTTSDRMINMLVALSV